MRRPGRAPLAQVGRHAVRRIADEYDRRANEVRTLDRAAPAVPLAAHALLRNEGRPALRIMDEDQISAHRQRKGLTQPRNLFEPCRML